MRRWLAILAVLACVSRGMAEAPPDPLRLVPRSADMIVRIEPRRLADAIRSVEAFQQFRQFPAVREALESTNAKRFFSLIAYYEKELGASWPELLDTLGGGGIVLAVKFERDNSAPVLAVIQCRDEQRLAKAVATVRKVIEQELARQDSPIRPKSELYRGYPVVHVGEVYYALAGSALVLSNKPAGVQRALDLHIHGDSESLAALSGPAAARKLLPPEPLVSGWINLAVVQNSPEGKEIFKLPKGDVAQLIAFGGLLDVIGKSPFIAFGGYRTHDGFAGTVRMPRGRDASPDGAALHLAPTGQAGTLPPLEPQNVLYSSSFYLDLGTFWSERNRLVTDGARKQFDRAEKQLGRFLAGRKLSELLTQSGPYHRFVAVAQEKSGYSRHSEQTIPAFAFVTSMRAPEFGQALNAMLRSAAFLAGSQFKLKLVEETVDGVELAGYRFPEDGSVPQDAQNLRFSFSPCFAAVGDQFFAASTLELGREMVGLLKKSPPATAPATTIAAHSRAFAAGGAALARIFEEQQVTQAILDRAVSPADAAKEVRQGIDWLLGLGMLDMTTDYQAHEFRFDVRWEMKKK